MGVVDLIVTAVVYIFLYMVTYGLFWAIGLGLKGLKLDWWNQCWQNEWCSWFLVILIAVVAFIAFGIFTFLTGFSGGILVFVIIFYILRIILGKIWLVGPIILKIPPFPEFEDSGLFGLMDRINQHFYESDEKILNAVGLSSKDIVLFTKDALKDIIRSLFPNSNINDDEIDNIFDNQIEPEKIDASGRKVKKTDEEIRRELNPYYDNTLKAIDVEINNCIISRTAPIPMHLSQIEKSKIQASNEFAKMDCYSSKIESYIKANLQFLVN
jgi:hypothetical protein